MLPSQRCAGACPTIVNPLRGRSLDEPALHAGRPGAGLPRRCREGRIGDGHDGVLAEHLTIARAMLLVIGTDPADERAGRLADGAARRVLWDDDGAARQALRATAPDGMLRERWMLLDPTLRVFATWPLAAPPIGASRSRSTSTRARMRGVSSASPNTASAPMWRPLAVPWCFPAAFCMRPGRSRKARATPPCPSSMTKTPRRCCLRISAFSTAPATPRARRRWVAEREAGRFSAPAFPPLRLRR